MANCWPAASGSGLSAMPCRALPVLPASVASRPLWPLSQPAAPFSRLAMLYRACNTHTRTPNSLKTGRNRTPPNAPATHQNPQRSQTHPRRGTRGKADYGASVRPSGRDPRCALSCPSPGEGGCQDHRLLTYLPLAGPASEHPHLTINRDQMQPGPKPLEDLPTHVLRQQITRVVYPRHPLELELFLPQEQLDRQVADVQMLDSAYPRPVASLSSGVAVGQNREGRRQETATHQT